MTPRDDLVSRLLFAAENTQGCLYSQRKMLKEAATALEAKDAEIAEWRQAASVEAGLRREFLARVEAAESRIAILERQLAEETERCAAKADAGQIHMRELSRSLPNGEAKQCAQICAKAASEK
jgi:hypothetical protein